MAKLGIDLGTTYLCVSYVDQDGKAQIIDNLEGDYTTPSVVYFDPYLDEEAIVGRTAKSAGWEQPECFVECVKRYMEDPNYSIFVKGQKYSAAEVSALILQKLIRDAEIVLRENIEGVVLTIPAYFGPDGKFATKCAADAVRLSNGENLQLLRIISEPIATAVAVCNLSKGDMDKTVLIYDLGGATFDCSVMRLIRHSDELDTKIITIGGDRQLGGKDWDKALTNLICEKICAATGYDVDEIRSDIAFNAWSINNIERVKSNLSYREKTICHTDFTIDGNPCKERVEIKVEEFEDVTSTLLDQTIMLVNDMLEKKGLSMMSDIDEIILVGGSTKMPQVAKRLNAEYNKVIRSYEPDKIIAIGAAIVADKC